MFIAGIEKAHTNHRSTKGRQLLPLFIALILSLMIYPGKAHAQIVGDIVVDIPFQFHAGSAKLPPGKYILHMLDNSGLHEMGISSADGSASALFEVRATEAHSEPATSELIFNKYGDRYFLATLFDEGNPSGSEVIESSDEKRISQGAVVAQEHVPARHRTQQGS